MACSERTRRSGLNRPDRAGLNKVLGRNSYCDCSEAIEQVA